MKTYLQSRVIRMDKRENRLQFLDYGGNELFSSLMESDSDRPQALDRMCILLRKAVIFGKLKGRAAAYQYMISKANQMGFIKSKKIYAYRLTAAERERITEKVCKSTGAKYFFKKYGKNVIIYSALLGAAVILVVLIYNYMHSEKYLKRMYHAAEETVIIESAYKTDYGIKLTIHNNSLADYYICDLPTLKYTDEYDDRAIGTYYHCKNAKL